MVTAKEKMVTAKEKMVTAKDEDGDDQGIAINIAM